MSGDREIDSAISALRLGAYAFLRKPCQAEELMAALKGALEKRQLEKKNHAVALSLQFSQQRFKFLAESCPDIIYIVDASGRLTYINESVSALLGFAPGELIGQSYCVLVPESETVRARYVFQERRVGVRASKDVEIQVKCKHMDAWEGHLVGSNSRAISFTSMAIYDNSPEPSKRRYLGTYGIARDLSEVKAAEALASFHANHDTLTGLPNRLLFRDRLEVALVQARRKSVKAAVMFIDLDRFKSINDSLGHFSGDRLLRGVASRFKQTARKADTLARFGGDEFVLLLGEITDRRHAALVAEKLIQSLNEPFVLNGRAVNISASIGIAVFPTDGESIEELMRHADMAMYQVKNSGRNSHEFYVSTGSSAAQRKARSRKTIRAALSQNAFELRYQPQVDVHSGEVVRLAAAIRWNDPRAGLMSGADLGGRHALPRRARMERSWTWKR
jgi:diguanylate cyclase (GGDEF)-like protein/PAS domain S-box-containing protein